MKYAKQQPSLTPPCIITMLVHRGKYCSFKGSNYTKTMFTLLISVIYVSCQCVFGVYFEVCFSFSLSVYFSDSLVSPSPVSCCLPLIIHTCIQLSPSLVCSFAPVPICLHFLWQESQYSIFVFWFDSCIWLGLCPFDLDTYASLIDLPCSSCMYWTDWSCVFKSRGPFQKKKTLCMLKLNNRKLWVFCFTKQGNLTVRESLKLSLFQKLR